VQADDCVRAMNCFPAHKAYPAKRTAVEFSPMSTTAVNVDSGTSAEPSVQWSLGLTTAFRFFCCYWLLSALLTPNRVSVLDPIPARERRLSRIARSGVR
jgi:hypothetical protein